MIDKDFILDYVKEVTKDIIKDKSSLATAIFVLIGTLTIGGYYLHGWYSTGIQRSAQLAFSESLEMYNQSLAKDLTATKKTENDWEESDLAFKTAYNQNKYAKITPFFLVYRAQSLAKLGEIDQAISILDQAIQTFSGDKNFYSLFKVAKCLILFNGSSNDRQSAFENLKSLSNDKENPLQDMALYYLGEYYYSENDIEKAKMAFEDVCKLEFQNALDIESPWVKLATEKLKLL